ncbi:5'-methylthioadenosine/S-adenosylhomocysteine nucleosidase [Thermosipho ferrireducens]|uniref:5'-methylthioadenosine/S-adenosylhomocysteine nucleosidase n=1 Tax=Thermosipho ferrireducens TaxID=2571116 RepID=A0ABX7S8T7_9BACT|nr:5'-methylthioadenosine/S-adenosylhomocysteine nucleosidase [Thermosipho ferrireducens]QTA38256.1 5'-methylthioadenosine/S-adenosylhomocysteine nucleosidase [Thermosipho ferrireducens]
MIVLTSVLKEEIIGAFRELLPVLENGEIIKRPYTRGIIGSNEIVLVYGLIGKVEAAMLAQAIIDKFNPRYFIHCGAAGALNPERKIGDIVCGNLYIEHDVYARQGAKCEIYGSQILTEKIVDVYDKVIIGTIASGDVFVESEDEKAKIYEVTKAEVVDMDSSAMAKVCYENGVDFCALKIVVDTSEKETRKEYRLNFKKLAPFPSAIVAEMLEKHLL